MEEIKGTLSVSKTKDGKPIYKAKFEGKKGMTEMGILPSAMYFATSDATDGAPIVIHRDAGQIKKVTIEGKPETPPAGKTADRPASQGQNFNTSRGYVQANRYGSAPQRQSFDNRGRDNRGGYGGGYGGQQPQVNIPPATAAYNFIPQTCVLEAPKQDKDEVLYSGTIVCSLKSLTPLLISGTQDAKSSATVAARKEFFSVNDQYSIPGSSLKGLLRSCVEILTCSTMQLMNNRRAFWRNFDDERYKEVFKMGQQNSPQKAGYLVREGADFKIIPVNFEIVLEHSRPNPSKTRVVTGNMMKKKHAYDFDKYQAHANDRALIVSDQLLDDFLLQLTPAQEKFLKDNYHIDGEIGIKRNLRDPLPVFYLEVNGEVDFFGLARYFRYPTRFTPIDLRNNTMAPLAEDKEDFAMQLFGFSDKNKSLLGRVSFSAAFFSPNTKTETINDVVLGQPHHTCFAHYLVQEKSQLRPMKRSRFPRWDINSMTTYNSNGKIRGRKYYWHRNLDIKPTNASNKKFMSTLVPVKTTSEAECMLYLDRLTLVELGAILESLILPEGHAHKIGMGKSLGLGSVRFDIKTSDISACSNMYGDVEKRCLNFFSKESNVSDQDQNELFAKARQAFQTWLLNALTEKGQKVSSYADIPHIAAFLHMTDFAHKPDNSKTAIMDLRDFQALRVLPECKDIK